MPESSHLSCADLDGGAGAPEVHRRYHWNHHPERLRDGPVDVAATVALHCGGNRCQCPIDEEDRWSILSLDCVVGNVRVPSPPRPCTSAITASVRSRWRTTTSASPPASPGRGLRAARA